jgi:hypothetical protein
MAVDLRRLTATFEAIMGEGKTAGHASNPRSTGSLDVHFGEKLRARRLIGHVSQQDLAKALGMLFRSWGSPRKFASTALIRRSMMPSTQLQRYAKQKPEWVADG